MNPALEEMESTGSQLATRTPQVGIFQASWIFHILRGGCGVVDTVTSHK